MENKDNRINQILSYLASAATMAADGVNDVMQGAGGVLSEKYTTVKLMMEQNRLRDAQSEIFADIGRTMFMIKTGVFNTEQRTPDGEVLDAQRTVDDLLQGALARQAEIDAVASKLAELGGSRACPICGQRAASSAMFCARCGAKLPNSDFSHSDGAGVKPTDTDQDSKKSGTAAEKAPVSSARKKSSSAAAAKGPANKDKK